MADWPIDIDSKYQLFVDDYMISLITHVSRHFHQPVKHPENALMAGGSVVVLYDKEQGRFRMWKGLDYLTITMACTGRNPM